MRTYDHTMSAEMVCCLQVVIADLFPGFVNKYGGLDEFEINASHDEVHIGFRLNHHTKRENVEIGCNFTINDDATFDIGGCQWKVSLGDLKWVSKTMKQFDVCTKPRGKTTKREWHCDECKYDVKDDD